jgi:hypothetical protein
MVSVQPAMITVTSAAGAMRSDLCVTERLGHVLCSVHLTLSSRSNCCGFVCENVCCELLNVSEVVAWIDDDDEDGNCSDKNRNQGTDAKHI